MNKEFEQALEQANKTDFEILSKKLERERNTLMMTNNHLIETIKRQEKIIDKLVNILDNVVERR